MPTYKTPGVYVEEISTLPPSVAEVATAIPAFIGFTEKVPLLTESFLANKTKEGGGEATTLEFTLGGQPISGVFTDSGNHLFEVKNQDGSVLKAYNESSRKITVDVQNINNGEVITVSYPAVQPVRIGSMLEYRAQFGGGFPSAFDIPVQHDQQSGALSLGTPVRKGKDFLMYYSMQLYFSNGGGPCYILSVGNYEQSLKYEAFAKGMNALSKEDEPTLILLTDAVNLPMGDYYTLCQDALAQCAKLKDRFAIFDLLPGDTDAADFRNGIGNNNLNYGAAYTPSLSTFIPYTYEESRVNISEITVKNQSSIKIGPGGNEMEKGDPAGILLFYDGPQEEAPKAKITLPSGASTRVSSPTIIFDTDAKVLHIALPDGSEEGVEKGASLQAITEAFNTWAGNQPPAISSKLFFQALGDKNTRFETATSPNTGLSLKEPASLPATLNDNLLKKNFTGIYNEAITALAAQRVVLPPSTAMAGIYANVDRTRGVWKAPANVSVNAVAGPVRTITTGEQENLNIDATSGKSINAIRAFTGKGTLVWGGRTLAGNDNEWRYISVRRLFIMIEESIQKSTSFAVFEPNDTSTWLKVKAMIDSYLYGLWQQGALAGPSPEQAYFVNIGLGKSMTTQDILEGRMIVEVGVAAVRPAEFIILRFSHKLQEA